MRVLRHDATLLVQAAAQAQRAADYIQNLHPDTDASLVQPLTGQCTTLLHGQGALPSRGGRASSAPTCAGDDHAPHGSLSVQSLVGHVG